MEHDRCCDVVQNQFLGQLRQRHLEQQQQVIAQEAARQHEMQQRMLASLTPQQMHQLQSMPKVGHFDCL